MYSRRDFFKTVAVVLGSAATPVLLKKQQSIVTREQLEDYHAALEDEMNKLIARMQNPIWIVPQKQLYARVRITPEMMDQARRMEARGYRLNWITEAWERKY